MKRAAPFLAIFVVQALCAFFFVSDILSSFFGFQTAPISWEMRELLEIAAAFGSLELEKLEDKKKKPELSDDVTQNLSNDQIMQQMENMRRNPSEFTDFSIPWSVNLSYSLSYAKILQPDYRFTL